MHELTAKSHLMLPPVDFTPIQETLMHAPVQRKKRSVFVETRDANVELLNAALATLLRRGEKFELITVGPVEDIDETLPRTTLPENDELAHVKAMLSSGVFISTKVDCPADYRGIRALAAGCWPIVPAGGCYPEIIPKRIHGHSMHDGTPSGLSSKLQDTWHLEQPTGYEDELADILGSFDPMVACKAIDERIDQLCAAGHSTTAHPPAHPADAARK
jgi:hypothetical protein